MMNMLCILLLSLCCVLYVPIHSMDLVRQLDSKFKLQEILDNEKRYEGILRTRLGQQTHQIKERMYVLNVLECATVFLSWCVGSSYAGGVLVSGAAAIGAFTWQLADAVESKDFIQEQIVGTKRYQSVLQTLLVACDDEQLRHALQPRRING